MPYRRRRIVRKRRYGGIRRRMVMSPTGKSGLINVLKSVRPRSLRTHYFKRLAQDITLSVDSALNEPKWSGNACLSTGVNLSDDYGTWQTGMGMNFNLSECIDSSELTSLFDRYKILGVKLKFLFQSNHSGYPGGNRAPLPVLTYAFDADGWLCRLLERVGLLMFLNQYDPAVYEPIISND